MNSSLFCGSTHALLYSKFRPSPPKEFINVIINYLRNKVNGTLEQAVDIGCGSGQSTIVLAPYFKKVTGCDISEAQIDCAKKERSAHNVEYKITDCEVLPFQDSTVELVTSSEAAHWFDMPKLFAEIKRILIPNGVVAIYGYWIPFLKTGNEEKDKKLENLVSNEIIEEQLRQYFGDEMVIVRDHYRSVIFPFQDVQRLDITAKSESSLAAYLGYYSSISAYQKLHEEDKEKAEKLLKDFEKECLHILGETRSPEEILLSVHIDFFMLIGHTGKIMK